MNNTNTLLGVNLTRMISKKLLILKGRALEFCVGVGEILPPQRHAPANINSSIKKNPYLIFPHILCLFNPPPPPGPCFCKTVKFV